MEVIEDKIKENIRYTVQLRPDDYRSLAETIRDILLREYGLADEKIPDRGHAGHQKAGIIFYERWPSRKGPSILTLSGPLKEYDKIESYIAVK